MKNKKHIIIAALVIAVVTGAVVLATMYINGSNLTGKVGNTPGSSPCASGSRLKKDGKGLIPCPTLSPLSPLKK